jgi:hypothetical protein
MKYIYLLSKKEKLEKNLEAMKIFLIPFEYIFACSGGYYLIYFH